ncbi:MAG: IreB family regulatory phosphoprotein [Clostridiales bacterium]|nr:IreB family regulatory phosphoprotein [Clostridiales bacterium]
MADSRNPLNERTRLNIPDSSQTQTFSIHEDRDTEIRSVLSSVYNALRERGYNPIDQMVGYLLTEDPTYITNYKNARALIRRVDRDEVLRVLLAEYLRI